MDENLGSVFDVGDRRGGGPSRRGEDLTEPGPGTLDAFCEALLGEGRIGERRVGECEYDIGFTGVYI